MMVFNIVIVMLLSFIPYIDWAAHLFGLLSGILLGLWYFAPALGGTAFAFDAPSPAAARREAERRAAEAAAAGPPGYWAAAGVGRVLATGLPASPPPPPTQPGCALRTADAAAGALCAPLLPAAAACCGKAQPPPGLWRGTTVASAALAAYLALLGAGFALLYGGYVDASYTELTEQLFFPCRTSQRAALQNGYPALRCPY
jgi:hypothetical protein